MMVLWLNDRNAAMSKKINLSPATAAQDALQIAKNCQ